MPCDNPNCPVHGDGAEKLREVEANVVANAALMNIVRALAANVMSEACISYGLPPSQRPYIDRIMEILNGNKDDHVYVQGIMHGFVKLITEGHPQLTELAGRCADVKESDDFLEKVRRTPSEAASQDFPGMIEIPGLGYAIPLGSGEDLASILKGMMGGRPPRR